MVFSQMLRLWQTQWNVMLMVPHVKTANPTMPGGIPYRLAITGFAGHPAIGQLYPFAGLDKAMHHHDLARFTL